MVNNIYKHNSRSFYDVYNALVTAYPRKPTWVWNEMAALFDFQSELMNRIATDIMYPITRESAYAFAQKCGYTPIEADGATDTLTITLTSAMTKTLAAGYQVGGQSTATGKMVIFETTAAGSSGGTSTITVAAKQKKTIGTDLTPSTWKLIGTVLNTEDYYDYPIDGYTKIINDSTFQLYIDGEYWTRVSNFDSSTSTSTHFMPIYQSSGKVRVRFGNGTYGKKPTVGASIYAHFSYTEGLKGAMEAGDITINVGQDADISSITNAGTTGGNDAESVNSIVINSIKQTRHKNIVWSEEDLELAALEASSSVIKAKGFGGIGSASIHIIPSDGGTPATTLLEDVEEHVVSLTQFAKMPVTVTGATYVPISITATVTCSPSLPTGFTETNVKDLVRFALSLSTSAVDSLVIDRYDEYGIDDCRTSVIAILYPTYTFASIHNDALEFIIKQWKSLLSGGDRNYRDWGQPGEVGNFWIMGDSLVDYGVDEFNITLINGVAPSSNIEIDDEEIINTGTITVS